MSPVETSKSIIGWPGAAVIVSIIFAGLTVFNQLMRKTRMDAFNEKLKEIYNHLVGTLDKPGLITKVHKHDESLTKNDQEHDILFQEQRRIEQKLTGG